MMKLSEAMVKYREKIEPEMVKCYRDVLENYGRIQYDIYVWEDGEIVVHEDVQGGNAELVPGDGATRELFCVACVKMPFYDPWDGADHGRPEDEEEAEREEKELIDYEVEEYEYALSDHIYDEMVAEAKQDEKYFDA